MKKALAILFSLGASAAQAHPSLIPHRHPHGVSMLPDLGTFLVGGIFMLALALVAYTRFGRTP
jgi:divalent metal cation (Fe/Co/Zn/Cd) transporter